MLSLSFSIKSEYTLALMDSKRVDNNFVAPARALYPILLLETPA